MRRTVDVPFDASSTFGNPGLQPLDLSSQPAGGGDRGWVGAPNEADETYARQEAAYQEYLKQIMQLPAGVSPAAAERVAGMGPDRKDFNQYASLNPEGAAQEMDMWERGMGVPQPSDPNAQSNEFRKGTMAAPSDGEQIPYYTNQPVGQEDARAQDLQPFNAGIGGTSGISGPDPTQAVDPRMREVAMRARQAREMIALVPKSADVVSRGAAQKLPGFVHDIKTLGFEGASNKAFEAVGRGELSTAELEKLRAEGSVEAKRQIESDYAKTREKYVTTARDKGTLYAARVLQEERKNAKGDNPDHLVRIERELEERGKSKTELDAAQINPADSQFLPLSENDVNAFRGGTTAPVTGSKVDATAPPTIMNPHDGPTTIADSAANADKTIQELMGVVTSPDMVGTAAQAPSSYTMMDREPQFGDPATAENPRSDVGKKARNIIKAMRKRQHESDLAPYDPNAQSDIAKLLGF